MNKELTSVEWLIEQLTKQPIENINDEHWFGIMGEAKELHRQQIIDAVNVGFEEGCNFPECIIESAEQYYNNKYGK